TTEPVNNHLSLLDADYGAFQSHRTISAIQDVGNLIPQLVLYMACPGAATINEGGGTRCGQVQIYRSCAVQGLRMIRDPHRDGVQTTGDVVADIRLLFQQQRQRARPEAFCELLEFAINRMGVLADLVNAARMDN